MERGECKVVGSCSPKWREKMVVGGEENDGMKTVECLRGRLLAEREASKAAKQDADLLMERLTKLERLLAEETKSRDRAVKRLRFALKKLRSLSLIDDLGSSSSSELLGGNMGSSSSTCSDGKKTRESCAEEKGNETGGVIDARSFNSSPDSSCKTVSEEGSWSSVGSAQSVNMCTKHCSEECNEARMDSCHNGISADSIRNTCDEERHQKECSYGGARDMVSEDIKADGGYKKPDINGKIELRQLGRQ